MATHTVMFIRMSLGNAEGLLKNALIRSKGETGVYISKKLEAIRASPIDNQKITKNHSAQVCKMGYIAATA